MGLFDKVLEKVNTAVDGAQNFLDPFSDLKEYYEITYCLLSSVNGGFTSQGIKNYIEHHSAAKSCDEEKLEKVLKFFDNFSTYVQKKDSILYSKYRSPDMTPSFSLVPNSYTNFLKFVNEVEESMKYKCTKIEAYSICYKDVLDEILAANKLDAAACITELKRIYTSFVKVLGTYRMTDMFVTVCYDKFVENIKAEYDVVLNVVEKQGVKFYKEGISRISHNYDHLITRDITDSIIYNITKDHFFKHNPTVETVLVTYLYLKLYDYNKEISNGLSSFAAVTLRANHFNKFGQNAKGYTTITKAECRNFVLNNETYKEKINQHPFHTEEYIESYATNILSVNLFKKSLLTCWLPYEKDDYYIDALCFSAWAQICKMYNVDHVNSLNDVAECFIKQLEDLYEIKINR